MSMHTATIRFGDELWERLNLAAKLEGVSIAAYVREATATRLLEDRGLAATDRQRASRQTRRAR